MVSREKEPAKNRELLWAMLIGAFLLAIGEVVVEPVAV